VWSWIDDTPKGFTIHYIDDGVDTGDIILRCESKMMVSNEHTLRSSYLFLHAQLQEEFMENWCWIRRSGSGYRQAVGSSYHRAKDLDKYLLFMAEGWDTPISEFLEAVGEMQMSAAFVKE
jgi:methionyl-tRNA formyltransferase